MICGCMWYCMFSKDIFILSFFMRLKIEICKLASTALRDIIVGGNCLELFMSMVFKVFVREINVFGLVYCVVLFMIVIGNVKFFSNLLFASTYVVYTIFIDFNMFFVVVSFNCVVCLCW